VNAVSGAARAYYIVANGPNLFHVQSYDEQDKAFLDLTSLAECNLNVPLIAGQWSLYTPRWLSSVAARAVDLSDLRHEHIRVRVLSGLAIQTVLYLKIRFTIPKDT
jgi:hypothetical protein